MTAYTLAQHEYQIQQPDGTWPTATRQDNMSLLPDGRHQIGNLIQAIPVGGLRVRVIALSPNPAGDWLYNTVAFTASTTTPAAPIVAYNSTTRTLTASHSLGGTLQFSYQGSAFVDYIGALQVDGAQHVAGDWQFKRLASSNYNESPVSTNPAIAAKPVASGKTQLFFFGDSNTIGQTGNGETPYYTFVQQTLAGPDYGDFTPFARSGYGIDHVITAQLPGAIAALDTTYAQHIGVLLIGINDLGANMQVRTLLTKYKQALDLANANGIKLLLATYPAAGQGRLPAPLNEFNRRLRAYWQEWGAYGLLDFAARPELSDYTNPLYFYSDQLHHTTKANQEVKAPMAVTAIQRVAAGNYFGVVTALVPTTIPGGSAYMWSAYDVKTGANDTVTSVSETIANSNSLAPQSSTLPTLVTKAGYKEISFGNSPLKALQNIDLLTQPFTLLLVVQVKNVVAGGSLPQQGLIYLVSQAFATEIIIESNQLVFGAFTNQGGNFREFSGSPESDYEVIGIIGDGQGGISYYRAHALPDPIMAKGSTVPATGLEFQVGTSAKGPADMNLARLLFRADNSASGLQESLSYILKEDGVY